PTTSQYGISRDDGDNP
ncbi:unnamed protein product, partial [Rotaria sordida]